MIQELKLPLNEEYGAELHCPHCGSVNLHISRIEVQGHHQRIVISDNAACVRATDNTPQVTPNGNDGFTVRHWCEGCPEEPTLAYFFHKGTTYMGWVK
jgi:hypothetical protein